ncbi:MAG: ABC transporter ATP-binding protein, partial [Thiobacillus sp.]
MSMGSFIVSDKKNKTEFDMKILEVKKLIKHFGGIKAVDEISFDVNIGEIRAIIGPNGAGKTTVFELISGFKKPLSGEIILNGKRIDKLLPYQRACLGLARTFQKSQIFGNMTVLDNLMVGQHLKLKAGFLTSGFRFPFVEKEEIFFRQKAMELIDFMGLSSRTGDMASALSYGEQRMLEIARALGNEPKILLLDEPAAGLSSAETDILISKIKDIRDNGVTVLLIEHDMSLIMQISDKVSVLNYGRKIAEGTPEEIRNNDEVIESYLGKGFKKCN